MILAYPGKNSKAFHNFDIEYLKKISDEQKEEGSKVKQISEINLNEEDIMNKYRTLFEAFTKKSIDTPKHVCISCQNDSHMIYHMPNHIYNFMSLFL